MRIRNLLLGVFTLLALGAVNLMVIQKEYLAANGQVVLLPLAPVDPRSLMQGDYMMLRYAISNQVHTNQRDGFIVVRLDENDVAEYVRIHNEQIPLGPDEVLMRFRQRKFDIRIGAESFFFQEGHAHYYSSAWYGEVRVSSSGDVLLVGLRGPNLEVLGPP